jgi:hypothetical protein
VFLAQPALGEQITRWAIFFFAATAFAKHTNPAGIFSFPSSFGVHWLTSSF